MQERLKIYTLVFLSVFLIAFSLTFDYYTSFHTIVIHLYYVLIVLSILWYRTYGLLVAIALILFHLALDAISMKAIPWEALQESLVQLLLLVILYWIVIKRDEANKQVNNLIDATNVGTWQWNFKTNKVDINHRWAEMLGYEKEELSPITISTWEHLAHPEDLDKSNIEIEKVMKGLQDFYEIDARMKHKNGHYIWVHDRGSITKYDKLGEPLIMSGTHQDITQRKKADLQESYFHNLLDYIINHMNSGIAVHDKDLHYIYVSQKYLDQYHLSNEDVIGKHHYDVFPDLPDKWKKIHQLALKGEVSTGDRDPFPREDGHIDWTRWECRPLYNERDEINGIVVYTEVINDQIKIEQELEEKVKQLFIQKEEIEATLLAIGDAVISTDEYGIINAFNDIAENLTGYTKKEAYGMKFDDVFTIINETTKEALPSPVKEVLSTKKTVSLSNHTALVSKSGEEYIIEDSAAPIFNQNNELMGVILVFRDVTDKKAKQKEIEYLSLHDFLTSLYNRRFFAEELARIDKINHYPLGLMMIDLNGLKILNDAYGHEIGDLALCEVAQVLRDVIQDRGVVSRIGGDEFTVLISNTSHEEMIILKEQVHKEIDKVKIRNVPLSLAIGYTIKNDEKEAVSSILKKAEDMMYKLKLVEGVSARNHTIKAILKTLTEKHELERVHSERVSNICYLIGEKMGLNEDSLKELKLSGLFHDIGKISIPDNILFKPDKLTKEEYEIIKQHPKNGYQILRAADEYSDFAEHALYHHEKIDGSGYPNGLKGKDIPLFSRIISVADAYEAMTSDRPYRNALPAEQAIQELEHFKGTQFDKKIVDVFVKMLNDNHKLMSTV